MKNKDNKECEAHKKLKSAIEVIQGLYSIDKSELCEDEMKLLYVLTKKLRKKVTKITKEAK